LEQGALNIITVKLYGCDDRSMGGYAAEGLGPILSLRGIGGNLGQIIMHELGHSAGLLHANIAVCPEPLGLVEEACEVFATDDPSSLMGYTNDKGSDDFSLPEMFELGLLEDAEVLDNPASGDYKLSGFDAPRGEPKVLKIGQNAYISWEDDIQASHDIECKKGNYTEHSAEGNFPDNLAYTTTITIDGHNLLFSCYKVNQRLATNTLQVRDGQKKGMHLIARPDRAPDALKTTISNGEVIPNTVVHDSKVATVTYIGQTDQNQAIVRVLKK